MRITRRRALLALPAVAVAGAAGCLGPSDREPDGPAGTPDELICDDHDFRRLDPPFTEDAVSYTTLSAGGEPLFELALDGRTIAYGSTVRIALRNRTDDPHETGPKEAFSLQRNTESGWQELRGTTEADPADVVSEATVADRSGAGTRHAPGEGFVWDLTLEEAEIAGMHPSDAVSVCPPLGTGSYRFVYWGFETGALAEEFSVVGPG